MEGYDATLFVMSRKLSSYATRSQLRRKPTVVTLHSTLRGPNNGTSHQPFWQCGPGGPIFFSTVVQRSTFTTQFEEGQEGKEVVLVVTPLQEQGRGRARAVQGHNAVGRSVGVDIPILSPQLPTAQLESTLTFPEATVNEQAVGQAGGQRVGKIARVPILAAPNNYGKQLARNDIAGDIVQSAIIHGPRARRPTPITHPTHLAVEERTGDDQERSDIANFALFTRVIQVPAKKARDHPLVYAAQKEEVDGLYKMGTLTWVNKKEAWKAGVPPVHTHFVNSIKVNEETGDEKHKARLCANGKRKQFVHFSPYEKSSPTAQQVFLFVLLRSYDRPGLSLPTARIRERR
eukprot:g21497.t1